MTRKILLIICLSLFVNSIFAQIRTSIGIGALAHSYNDVAEFEDIEFNSYVLPHFHFQLSAPIAMNDKLRWYSQVNILPKQQRFELSTNLDNEGVLREGYFNLFWSGELELGFTYDIPIKNLILSPKFGGFVAFNFFSGVEKSYMIEEFDDDLYKNTSYSWGVSYTNPQGMTTYGGLTLGLALNKITKKGRTTGLFTDVYMPVQDMSVQPIQYAINGRDFSFQGRFTYVNLGVRFGINRN
ncbi:MAG: hypothetical protein AB8G11_07530 [Saprospiraceae bacterium]